MIKIVVKVVSWLVVVFILLTRPGMAKELPLMSALEGEGAAPVLYTRLLHNIEEEAGHYSEYVDYRKALRLSAFWDQLERMNLSRDEIIQAIARLEKKMEGAVSEGDYPISSKPFELSDSGGLDHIFSNWRPFYVLMSGGFFLFISGLFLFSCGITCRRSVFFMLNRAFKGLPVYDLLEFEESGSDHIFHKRAA